MKNYRFFLGGRDLEMVAIKSALVAKGVAFDDAGLGWGAKASAYGTRIAESTERGVAPVLVELEIDCDLPEGTIVVDHHGARSAEKASLLQVLDLIGVEPNREQLLVAADDAGFIPGMLALEATPEEVFSIRARTRECQGITAEQEAEAERAITFAERPGKALVVVRMAHSKCATVTDRLFSSWPEGRENLLVVSVDGEVNYFGRGDICLALKATFEGWGGGSGFGKAEGQGYWGGNPSQPEAIATFILDRL